ncbi:MAG: uL15 family ribosomal protein [Nanoarchaeota archaeon]|nr:uL15 family ribosomal protein [Nanoarchaeota archaeon]
MVKTHKRTKNSRIRGARTVGWGFRQKHKGHGNKGGFGMAGTGKRGDHKKQTALESDTRKKKRYFGKQGVTSRGTAIKKYEKINLSDIKANFFKKDGDKIDFSKHKILGHGDGFKAEIKALAATASAIEKMEKAGGKIILPVAKEAVKQHIVKEAPKKEDKAEKKK